MNFHGHGGAAGEVSPFIAYSFRLFYNETMFTIIFGIACALFTVFACLPAGLGWGDEIIFFLKGGIPVFTAFIALVAILIGIADVRDRLEAEKEEDDILLAESEEKSEK